MIFCIGFYLRGTFVDGKLDGNVMMRTPKGRTFLMRFSRGVLSGVSSILKKNNWVKVVEFEDGKMKQVLKNFKANDDNFSKSNKLFDSVFESDLQAEKEISSFTEQMSETLLSWDKEVFFGTFSVLEHGIYYGMVKYGQPSGFGIYFSDKGKIKTGWFRDGAMVGKTRIIDSGGLIMDSNFKNDQAYGDTLIYHIQKNDWKQVFIDYNKVDEMDSGKGYPRYELNRQNRWTGMIRKADYEIDMELSTVVIDVNNAHELLLIFVSGVTKRTFGVFDDSFGAKRLTYDYMQEWSVGYNSNEKEVQGGSGQKATVETRRILQKYEMTDRITTPGSPSKRSMRYEDNIKNNLNFSESSIYKSDKKGSNMYSKTITQNVYFSNQKNSLSPKKSFQKRSSHYRLSQSRGRRSSQKQFSMKIEEEDYESYAKQSVALESVQKRLKHKIKLKKNTIRPYSPYEQRREIHERVKKKTTYIPRSYSPYKRRRRRVRIPKYVKKHVSPYSVKRDKNIIDRVPSTRSIWRYTKTTQLEDPGHSWERTFQKTVSKVNEELKGSKVRLRAGRHPRYGVRKSASLKRVANFGRSDCSNLRGETFKYTFNRMKSKPYDKKREEDTNMKLIRGIYKDVISNYVGLGEYEDLLEFKDNEMIQEGAKEQSNVNSRKGLAVRSRRQSTRHSSSKREESSHKSTSNRNDDNGSSSRLIKLTPDELEVFKGLKTLSQKRKYLEKIKKSRLKLSLGPNKYTLKKADGPLSFRKASESQTGVRDRPKQPRKEKPKVPKMSLNIQNINFSDGLDLKSTERFGEFNNIRLEMKYGDDYCRYGKQDQDYIRQKMEQEQRKENLDINSGSFKGSSHLRSGLTNQEYPRSRFMDSKIFI